MSGIFYKCASAACAVAVIYNAFVSNHVLPNHNIEESGRLKSVRAVSNTQNQIVPWVLFIVFVMNSKTGLVFTMSEYHGEEERKENVGKVECTSFK